jgi:hypothetical protein
VQEIYVIEEIVAILAVLCAVGLVTGLVFGFFVLARYLRYRETLRLVEKGLIDPHYSSNGKGTLRWGLVLTGFGLALCVGLYPLGWVDGLRGVFPLNFGPWMLVGLLPAFFGLALLAVYRLTAAGGPVDGDIPMEDPGETNDSEAAPGPNWD